MWPFPPRCGALPTLAEVARPAARGRLVTEAVTIPVERIVGTVARCCDLDRCFRPRHRHLAARLDALRQRFADGMFPAIEVLQVGGDYVVIDGHHRVALARERGIVAIDAIVTRRVPDADLACGCHLGRRTAGATTT